jgi:DNA-binding NtrC family response regulator
MPNKHHVLILRKQEPEMRELAAVLNGFAMLEHVDSVEEIPRALRSGTVHAVFCPWRFGTHEWTDVLSVVQQRRPELPVIVVAKKGGWEEWAQVLEGGGFDLLVSPIHEITAMATLQQAAAIRFAQETKQSSRKRKASA